MKMFAGSRCSLAAFASAMLLCFCAEATPLSDYRQILSQIELQPKNAKTAVERFASRFADVGSKEQKTMANDLLLRYGLGVEDFDIALKASEALLALAPNASQRSALEKIAAQLAFRTKRYKQTVSYVEKWSSHRTPEEAEAENARKMMAEMQSLAAYALWENEDPKGSVSWMRRAYRTEPSRQRGNFLLGAWQRLGDKSAEESFLPEMIRRYGDAVYWNRYGGLLYERGEERRALDVFSGAEASGRLSADLVPTLAALLLQDGAATKAAEVVIRHRDKLDPVLAQGLLVVSLMRSGDRKGALSAALADLPKGVESRAIVRQMAAQLAFYEEDWPLAVRLADELANKEKQAERAAHWRFMAGVAAFSMGDYARAENCWRLISSEKLRPAIEQWSKQAAFLRK